MPSLQPHLSQFKYRPDIDGLRGVAILSVVAFHAFPGWITGGFIGVDVFFVISGYLITTIILEGLDRGAFSFRSFYARRIKRIFPALILVLAVTYAFGWFALLPHEFKQLGLHVAGGASFVSNFVLWNEAGYFDNSSETKPLLHLWSLGIEEQFYIVWPLLLWSAWKLKFNILLLIIVVTITSFCLNVKDVWDSAVAVFYFPQTRSWELFCGGVLAWVSLYGARASSVMKAEPHGWPARTICRQNLEAPWSGRCHLLAGSGFLLLAYGFGHIDKSLSFPGMWALVPVLGTMLIIRAGPQAWLNRVVLSNGVAVWLGLISFPLYLWHWPILSFLHIIEGELPAAELRIMAVALSVVLAWITFTLIERPIRVHANSSGIVFPLAVAIVTVGGLAGISYETGIHERYWEGTQRFVLSKSASSSPKRADCHFPQDESFESRKVCEYVEGANIRVAVLGNSHGVELAFALSQGLKEYGMGLRHHTMSGCPISYKLPVGQVDRRSICAEWHDFAVHDIINAENINVVVLSYRIESQANQKVYRESLYAMIDDLIAGGKRVVLVLQAPMLDKHINYYIRRAFGREEVASKTLAQWKEQYNGGYLIATKVRDKVAVVDPAEAICDERFCYAVRNNNCLYFNKDHMSTAGALLVGRKLLPVVLEQLSEFR